MSNSVDPDEMAHLIWIYAVCKSLLLLPVAVKELTPFFTCSKISTTLISLSVDMSKTVE